MPNLKDYNAHNDLALHLSFLEHFVILVNENYISFKIVIIDLINFFPPYEEHELIVCPFADIRYCFKNYFNLSKSWGLA